MTLVTTTNRVNYTGDAAILQFSFSFKAVADGHIIPSLDAVAQSSGFTINRNADQDTSPGGTVDFTVAPGSGVKVTIERIVPFTQQTDYVEYDSFPAETHESALDNLTMQTQQNSDTLNRSIKLPVTDDGTTDTELPAYEAAKVLQWDPTNRKLINAILPGTVIVADVLFSTVGEMKTASLAAGLIAKTKGYYAAGDGGGAEYLIVAPQAFDGYKDHDLANSNIAVLQYSGPLNVKWFGAKGDNVADDTVAIQAALDFCARDIAGDNTPRTCYAPAGYYVTSAQLNVPDRVNIIGDGSLNTAFYAQHTNAPILYIGGTNNINFKGFDAQFRNVPAVARDTYTDAVCIRVASLYSFTWEDITVQEGYAGIQGTGSVFHATLDVTATRCYIGFDFLAGYTTSLDAKLVSFQCFHGLHMDGAYYSSLATFVDFCGFTLPLVASYNSDATIMPVAFQLTQSKGIHVRWFGAENSDMVLLVSSYTTATFTGTSVGYSTTSQWQRDANRTSIDFTKQAMFVLTSQADITMDNFYLRMKVSDGFIAPSSNNNTPLFYILATSHLNFTGSPRIDTDAYLIANDTDLLIVDSNRAANADPFLGISYPALRIENTDAMSDVLVRTDTGTNYQTLPLTSGKIFNIKVDNAISITSAILPVSAPVGTIITIEKDNTYNAFNVTRSGTDAIATTLTSIPLTTKGDYWKLEKKDSGLWALLEGRDSGSATEGNWIRRADGRAEYTRSGFNVIPSDSGTSITVSGIAHPITLVAGAIVVASISGMSGGEVYKVSIWRTYGIGTTTYTFNITATTGETFSAATSINIDILANGKWY